MNTIGKNDFTEIGKVRKAFGVNGAISIDLVNDKQSIADEAEFLFLEIDGGLVPFSINEFELRGNSIVVELNEIASKEQAGNFTGCIVFFSNEDISHAGGAEEHPMQSFVGYQISDKQKGLLSEISDLIEYPNNPVFEIIINGISVMIPAREELMESVDHESKVLYLNLPEGLIDIYLE